MFHKATISETVPTSKINASPGVEYRSVAAERYAGDLRGKSASEPSEFRMSIDAREVF